MKLVAVVTQLAIVPRSANIRIGRVIIVFVNRPLSILQVVGSTTVAVVLTRH